MSEEIKRGPGRPKADGVKKGAVSWKPASVTEVTQKEDGYRYRWVNKHPDNLEKKKAEGWDYDVKANATENRIEHGQSLTSTKEKHDVVLMKLPEELAEGRDRYHDEKNARRTAGLTSHLKKEMRDKGGNAPVHGNITISSLRGTQELE